MRLLDRFLLRELTVPLGYCLGGFLLFWLSFDLFSSLDEFQRKQLTALDIAELYWVRLPELMLVVLPVALLLAALYALSNHSRHHEITAIRAAGISLWRICVPYFAVGILLSLGLFWITEEFGPTAKEREREIKDRRVRTAGNAALVQNLNFRNARDQRIWNIGVYNPETGEMTNPHVEWRLSDGSMRTVIAKRGFRANGVWNFEHAQLLIYPPGDFSRAMKVQTNSIAIPEWKETPADIGVHIRFSKLKAFEASKRPQLSLEEIEYIRTHLELNPQAEALLKTQWHARVAQPWTCLVVALIAIPFGAQSGRRNVFIGVAASIFLCFAYMIMQRVGLALGNGGFVPGWLGAWFPNVLCGGIGLWLTARVK